VVQLDVGGRHKAADAFVVECAERLRMELIGEQTKGAEFSVIR